MQKKNQKKFFLFEILASKFVPLNCLYYKENTCHRHSVCYETDLKFCISLAENFRKSIAFTVMNKSGKGAAMEISRMFRRVYHVILRRIP